MNCQADGCMRGAVWVNEVDLPSAWEPTPNFRTLTLHVELCQEHSLEVTARVQALLEARSDIPNLLAIIEAPSTSSGGMA